MQGDPPQLEPEDDEFFDSHENEGFSTLTIFSLFACTIVMVISALFLSYMFLGYV